MNNVHFHQSHWQKNMNAPRPRPTTLIILDGWGCRTDTDANAIAAAQKPTWDFLTTHYPYTEISGSGRCVGLPNDQMGNSEVGHLNMGAGRIVNQDLTRIDAAIEDKTFFQKEVLLNAFAQSKKQGKAVHVMGLLSPGGVHSHERHLFALIDMAAQQNVTALFLHPFLDGRDTPPQSATESINLLEAHCRQRNCGRIVSLIGRYYAMDRDQRWERIQSAYELLVDGRAYYSAPTPIQGLKQAYARGETDEFVQATLIHDPVAPPIGIQDGDVIIFMNFRSDRAREITQAFINPDFSHFHRQRVPQLGAYICLSQYDVRFNAPTVFESQSLDNLLGEIVSREGLHQLRIAETEKYAHVTFFFNGGVEKPYPNEDRILIPSPKVATYDLQPEMSAPELTDQLIAAIESGKYDLIICNFANPDMVGHSGNLPATIKAIETIDTCLNRIQKTILSVGGELLITADHGNAEMMFDPSTHQPHTAHTSNLVPFIYLGRKAEIINKNGKLSDIAPTILTLMNLPVPKEMTGQSLVKLV
jgi:2,3-bisphosphoglycerate-independent phosphoglycerate mutase